MDALLVDGELVAVAVRWGVAAGFALLGLLCVVITVLGLPGLWALLLLAGGVQLSDAYWRGEGDHTFSPWTLAAVVLVALLAELLEFTAGAAGAKKAGASRRGMVGAMVGGLVGAILGAPFGLLVGAILGGMLGAAVGAILLELTIPGRKFDATLAPAKGAAFGRLKGIALKLLFSTAIWIALTVAVVVE